MFNLCLLWRGKDIIFETVSSTKVVMKSYGFSMTRTFDEWNKWIYTIHMIEATDKSYGWVMKFAFKWWKTKDFQSELVSVFPLGAGRYECINLFCFCFLYVNLLQSCGSTILNKGAAHSLDKIAGSLQGTVRLIKTTN